MPVTLGEFQSRITIERFNALSTTEGETPVSVGQRILRTAQNAIKAICIGSGGEFDESNEIITDAVYGYAIGLLYNQNQLTQGNDDMIRAEGIIKSLFALSLKNPASPNYGAGEVAICRVDVEDEY